MNIETGKCSMMSTNCMMCENLNIPAEDDNRYYSLMISELKDEDTLIFMTGLMKNNCFITYQNETHCTQCHKTISQRDTKNHLEVHSCSIDYFHEENCPSLKNREDTFFVHLSSIFNKKQRVTPHMETIKRPKYVLEVEDNIGNPTETSASSFNRSPSSSDDKQSQKKYNTTSSAEYLDYATLAARKSSFRDWPIKDPAADRMADGGWVYTGHRDMTFCYFCAGKAENWEKQDPWMRHMEMYPMCVYVKTYMKSQCLEKSITQQSLENQPYSATSRSSSIVEHQTINHQAVDPLAISSPVRETDTHLQTEQSYSNNGATKASFSHDYSQYPTLSLQTRINTFLNWPVYLEEGELSPLNMASAGWSSTGKGDGTICHSCEIMLQNWNPGDDPYGEHVRWSAIRNLECKFLKHLKQKKDEAFVNSFKESSMSPATHDTNTARENLMKSVMELGFSDYDVNVAINTVGSHRSVSDIVNVIIVARNLSRQQKNRISEKLPITELE